MMFKKKDFLKTKQKQTDFLMGTPTPSPPSKKKHVDLENSLRVHTYGGPAADAEAV